MAQLVEHILGKDEVPGPNPGSSSKKHPLRVFFCFEMLLRTRSGFPKPKGEDAGPHSL